MAGVAKVLRMREAAAVERCHTTPHQGSYSVGAHTFGMLCLLEALHPDPPVVLFRAILYHDFAERWTGDLPGFVKEDADVGFVMHGLEAIVERREGLAVKLTDAHDRQWLKSLDLLELFLWTEDEEARGNRHTTYLREYVFSRLQDWTRRSLMPAEVIDFVKEFVWERTADDAV